MSQTLRSAAARRRRVSLALAALLVAAACGGAGAGEEEQDQEPDSVTLATAWLHFYDTAGWYTAREEGYFEEERLEVDIVRGFGSGDTIQRVATGDVEFGVADMSSLIPLKINEDIPVIAVATLYARQPSGVQYRLDTGIQEPKDLEGRTIASTPGSACNQMFRVFARANEIDEDLVEWAFSDADAIRPALISGIADAKCGFMPNNSAIEEQGNIELGYFSYHDYGLAAYSQFILVAESTIEERPELVERFVRAALRGNEVMIEDPDRALGHLQDNVPDNDPALMRSGLEIALDYLTDEHTAEHGPGYISNERMEATFDLLIEAFELDPGSYTAQDFFTTDFLP